MAVGLLTLQICCTPELCFYPLGTFVADVGFEILRLEQDERLLSLFQQVAVYFVLLVQVVVGFEVTHLNVGTRDEPFGVWVE